MSSKTLPDGLSQAVFVGLDIVVPLIEGDLLKIPKLCRLYFQLLGYMLEAFPERMVALLGAPVDPGSGLAWGHNTSSVSPLALIMFLLAAALGRRSWHSMR